MNNFQIEIKNPYTRSQRHSTFVYLLNGFAMVGIGAFTQLLGNTHWIKTVFHPPVISVAVLSSGVLVYGIALLLAVFFRNKQWLQNPGIAKWVRIFCIVANLKVAIIFLISQWWVPAGISLVMLLAHLFSLYIQQKMTRPLLAVFDTQRITLPASARRSTLEWTEVEHVLLRHGNLTIDCAHNVLYQWTISKHGIENTVAFEAFCREQIELAKPKRVADW
ncbi:hypothetical protein [Rurimicrobium arvi]|uniref:Uncharacterized protein n=1 Tax=Rurimicrobium arvi TaxID=2049916 RepID=A0ABP8MHK6_9BACT